MENEKETEMEETEMEELLDEIKEKEEEILFIGIKIYNLGYDEFIDNRDNRRSDLEDKIKNLEQEINSLKLEMKKVV